MQTRFLCFNLTTKTPEVWYDPLYSVYLWWCRGASFCQRGRAPPGTGPASQQSQTGPRTLQTTQWREIQKTQMSSFHSVFYYCVMYWASILINQNRPRTLQTTQWREIQNKQMSSFQYRRNEISPRGVWLSSVNVTTDFFSHANTYAKSDYIRKYFNIWVRLADLLETQKSHDTVLLTLISIYLPCLCPSWIFFESRDTAWCLRKKS